MLSAALIVCVVFPVAGKFTTAQIKGISERLDQTAEKVKPEINQLLVDMGAPPVLKLGEIAPMPSKVAPDPCKALQQLMQLENSLKIVEHDARMTVFKVRYQLSKDKDIMESQEMGPLIMKIQEAANHLETSAGNCQTAIDQNKVRCQAQYTAEAKAEAEARAKANGITREQVIARAKAKAEAKQKAKAEAKEKAKAEAKVQNTAETKFENKVETKVESSTGKATRLYMAPKIFRHATPWTPWTTSWHGPVLGFAAVLAVVAVAFGATALALRSWRARSGQVGLMDGL